MRIIKPSFELINPPDYQDVLSVIEYAGRTCYRSESVGQPEDFIRRIIDRGHLSTIEHVSITARIVCDRGVTHELVRHRLCSFSQESTRYCNYSKKKFGDEITVIHPYFFDPDENPVQYLAWKDAMRQAEDAYMDLLRHGARPEEARSVLPNSLATSIIVSCNLREWRHVFNLRLSPKAHPQIREVLKPGFEIMKAGYPVFFEDLEVKA